MEELILNDYFTILRRWKKIFLAITLALLALLMLFVMSWSNYRSTATVQVDQPEISSSATTPLGGNPRDQMEAMADRRISTIQQKVLSTGSLIEVITKFDLYKHAREDTPIAIVAEKTMLKKIKLDLVSSSLANPSSANKEALSAIAFTLSFDYGDPLLAQQVTDELVTRFLDQDLKERRTEAQQTSAFLAAQITALEASLTEQEKKIADYQSTHGVSRPETLGFNQQIVATLTLNMQNLDAQISTNEGTLGSLRGQLASVDPYSRVLADGQFLTTPSIQLKALQAQYSTLTAQYGPEHPDLVKLRHQIAALKAQVDRKKNEAPQLKAQIADTRTNLEAAEKTYGPEHPDAVALRNQLQKLESQLSSLKPESTVADEEIVSDADNPSYLQLAAQVRSNKEQHKSLLEQRAKLQEQIDNYQKALIENPEAQKELAALTRDYENSQLRFRELKEKKMGADMDEQMQKDRTGERLSLINPPELPIDTQPPRKLLIIGSLMFSILGGFASVVVAQVMSQSVIGMRHLESVVGVAPLVAIPHIRTKEEIKNSLLRRLHRGTFAFGAVAVEHSTPYVKRLDPLFERYVAPHQKRVAPVYEKVAPVFKFMTAFGKGLHEFFKHLVRH